jgi:hypothetical protein
MGPDHLPSSAGASVSQLKRLVATTAMVGFGTLGNLACKQDQPAEGRPPTAEPAPRKQEEAQPNANLPPTVPPTFAPSPGPPEVTINETNTLQRGWLEVDEVDDHTRRAWAEGRIEGDRKIVIDTHNVAKFRLNLSCLRLNWKKRIVLRLDGFNSELTRKRWPIVRFVRTPAGAWEVYNPH